LIGLTDRDQLELSASLMPLAFRIRSRSFASLLRPASNSSSKLKKFENM
jgi:hypothetical protein